MVRAGNLLAPRKVIACEILNTGDSAAWKMARSGRAGARASIKVPQHRIQRPLGQMARRSPFAANHRMETVQTVALSMIDQLCAATHCVRWTRAVIHEGPQARI